MSCLSIMFTFVFEFKIKTLFCVKNQDRFKRKLDRH